MNKKIKKILLFIFLFFFMHFPLAIADCSDAWSAAFDHIDRDFLTNMENMMKKHQENTSNLTKKIPPIIRAYRCQLKWICQAAQLESTHALDNKNDKNKDKWKNNTFTNVLGCQQKSVQEIEKKFGSLSACSTIQNRDYLSKIWQICDLHTKVKIEQIKMIIPVLFEKDANRKQMAFLSIKLRSIINRLQEFQWELSSFINKFQHIVNSLQCSTRKCP